MWCHLLLMSPLIGLGLFLILPWPTALLLYLGIVAFSFFLYAKIRQSMHRPIMTGRESLLGHVAEVRSGNTLKVAGEHWLIAAGREQWTPGQQVRIIGFKGLRLEVQPVNQDGSPSLNHSIS
jgi:membrane protein implicated in regulation of membrane protease activity